MLLALIVESSEYIALWYCVHLKSNCLCLQVQWKLDYRTVVGPDGNFPIIEKFGYN